MVDPAELVLTLSALRSAFDDLGLEWAVGGSLASTTWGEPQATNDVDIVAKLRPHEARDLARRLRPLFYVDEDTAADAALRGSSFNAIDQRTFMKVDVFVPAAGPMGQGQLARRRMTVLPGGPAVPVLSPEDTILQKLRWYELGGRASDRQWRHVVSILRLVEGPLDDEYLDGTARDAGLWELLARARKDAESS